MLVKCPMCDNNVSSFAGKCPKCGTNPKTIVCQNCKSTNVDISVQTVGEIYNGRNEVRKKSAITRATNKKGRTAMKIATGGLWGLTPKKSEYKEIQRGLATYQQAKICVCQNCGNSWQLKNDQLY